MYFSFSEALCQVKLIGVPYGLCFQQLQDLWHQADVDGNDVIGFEEFKVVHSGHAKISQSAFAKFSQSIKREADTLLEQESASTFKEFLSSFVLDTTPELYGVALLCGCSFLLYEVKRYVAPFDFQTGKLADTTQSLLLSIDDAFCASLSEIGHMAMFLLCYAMTFSQALQIGPELVFCLVVLMVFAPCFYFAGQFHQASASGVYVSVGSFHIHIFWFMISAAFGFCFVWGLVILIALYLFWTFKYQRMPKGKDVKLGDLSSIMLGV